VNTSYVAPEPDEDEAGVNHDEARREIVADEAADESGWRKHLVEPKRIFLYGMRRLRQNQSQEEGPASCVHGFRAAPYSDRMQPRWAIITYKRRERSTTIGMGPATGPAPRSCGEERRQCASACVIPYCCC